MKNRLLSSRVAPWFCAVTHVAAILGMASFLRGGLLTEPEAQRRADFVAENSLLWSTGWILWMLAAVSLWVFYAWWAVRTSSSRATIVALLLTGVGVVCDVTGESLFAFVIVEQAEAAVAGGDGGFDFASYESIERIVTLLTAGLANGLYTLSGMLLMLRTADLTKSVRIAMWLTWISGLGMTVSAIFGFVGGIVAATIVLFPTLIVWNVWMALAWRRE